MRRQLSPQACTQLRLSIERAQQHLAYLLAIEDHPRVISEARRCRAAIHLCAQFAEREEDRHYPGAPAVILIETRAQVALATQAHQPLEALFHVDQGLHALLDHFVSQSNIRAYDRSREVRALERVRQRLTEEIFPGPRAELRRALTEALEAERYEDAARLRDHLRRQRPQP